MRLRFMTSGESHGRGLIGIIEGIPSGLSVAEDEIERDLARRQKGHGRGGRMKIEQDRAIIYSGVRWGRTIGSPIALLIENSDFKNWAEGMSASKACKDCIPAVTKPRPGHADLAGAMKYNTPDVRDILERSSARETATRVALGAVARKFLSEFNVKIGGFVMSIGPVAMAEIKPEEAADPTALLGLSERAEASTVRCPDSKTSKAMVSEIDNAVKEGHSLGGTFAVFATGLPVGLGSHIQWDARLDGRLAQALMSVQAIKGVEIGAGFRASVLPGPEVLDMIYPDKKGFTRKTNHSGGIEGGMTNGMPVIARAGMKPIPTQKKPLKSVDLKTRKEVEAAYERSDTCAVPAASVIAEAMTALILADAMLEKFGGDSMAETLRNHASYIGQLESF